MGIGRRRTAESFLFYIHEKQGRGCVGSEGM